MAYEPKTWNCGDTITAEELNRMEEGISSASGGGTALVVNSVLDEDGRFLDKTWQEIFDAMPNVVIESSNAEAGMYQRTSINNVMGYENEYLVGAGAFNYKATSASGYPKQKLN